MQKCQLENQQEINTNPKEITEFSSDGQKLWLLISKIGKMEEEIRDLRSDVKTIVEKIPNKKPKLRRDSSCPCQPLSSPRCFDIASVSGQDSHILDTSQLPWTCIGYSNFSYEFDFYFIEWSEQIYISWVHSHECNTIFFTSPDEISHIHDKKELFTLHFLHSSAMHNYTFTIILKPKLILGQSLYGNINSAMKKYLFI